ncbi:MAG: hypothetical protein V4487_05165 [Chlamydiota bacterium]
MQIKKFYLWTKREFLHILPVFIFFLISFNIINMTEIFLFKKAGITPFTFLHILIAAGLIAKVILVIDHLPFTNLFRNKPLIYNSLWKTLIYWLITLAVRFCMLLFPFLFERETFSMEFHNFVSQINWRLFTSIQTWYLLLFFLFVTVRELTEVIGPAKMRKIFFGW